MLRHRPLAAVLCAIVLAGAGLPASASAQSGGGAGDDQYQDPFASSQTVTTKSKPRTVRSGNGLSQTPNLGSAGAGTAAAGPSAPAAAAPALSGRPLPNTGSDPRLLVLAGLALLLAGIGLRLRTADETF